MHRVLLRIPLPFTEHTIPIFSYGAMMMLAFAAGMLLSARRARKAGIPRQAVLDIGLYSIICGIIGARLTFIITDMDTPRRLLEYFAVWHGGLTFQGGLFMALLVVIWYLHSHRLPAGKIADIFAPGLALGVGIGRVGCFLNGCCWGKITPRGFPLGVTFPKQSGAWAHQLEMLQAGMLVPQLERLGLHAMVRQLPDCLPVPVHPTQLYTTAGMLVIFLVLLVLDRLPRRDGMLMLEFLAMYSLFRFGIEFWRDDTPLLHWFGSFPNLRLGQVLALFTLLATAAAMARLRRCSPPSDSGQQQENRQ